MGEPQWVNTGPGDVLGPHDGLRVTFAQPDAWWTTSGVEAGNLRDDLAHLLNTLESGGFSIYPAVGAVVPPPGATAWTIDFKTPGNVAVVTAINELEGALDSAFDFLSKETFIRRVEKFTDQGWGVPIPYDELDVPEQADCDLACMLRRGAIGAGLIAGVALLLVYAPELKAAARPFTAAARKVA